MAKRGACPPTLQNTGKPSCQARRGGSPRPSREVGVGRSGWRGGAGAPQVLVVPWSPRGWPPLPQRQTHACKALEMCRKTSSDARVARSACEDPAASTGGGMGGASRELVSTAGCHPHLWGVAQGVAGLLKGRFPLPTNTVGSHNALSTMDRPTCGMHSITRVDPPMPVGCTAAGLAIAAPHAIAATSPSPRGLAPPRTVPPRMLPRPCTPMGATLDALGLGAAWRAASLVTMALMRPAIVANPSQPPAVATVLVAPHSPPLPPTLPASCLLLLSPRPLAIL